MKKMHKQLVLVLLTIIIIYSVGVQDRRPNPVNDCYQTIWGDHNRMSALGLYGMGARDVYDYCRELITSDPYADINESHNEMSGFIMGEPIIEVRIEPDSMIDPPALSSPSGNRLDTHH